MKHKIDLLEKIITGLMALFGIGAVTILISALKNQIPSTDLAIIELLFIIVLAILAQAIIMIKIYEQRVS